MKSKQKNLNVNLMIRIITTPYRAICKAKDFYIRSITDCANHSTYGRASMTYGNGNPLPRSTSTSSVGSASDSSAAEDLRELIRANSTARMGDLNINRADLELYIKQHMMNKQSMVGSRIVHRSASVGMGRIDEDAPVASFPDDEILAAGRKVKSDPLMFPRSRSHAVTSTIKIN